jgi:hypothetical protein
MGAFALTLDLAVSRASDSSTDEQPPIEVLH